ncbi:MAG: SGNH/GDSL hydrolase family protein [Bacteroidota bacterium]
MIFNNAQLKYLLAAVPTVPLLPIMYLQGQRIRRTMPQLPPATLPEGLVELGTKLPTKRLIFLGESTVAGVGVKTHAEGFAGTMAQALAEGWQSNVDWRVYAQNGYTARTVRKRLLPQIQEKEADWIVIGLGGNDAFGLNSPLHWRRELQQLIDELRLAFPTTPIAFANMPPIKIFPAFTPLMKQTIGNLVELLGDTLVEVVQAYPQVYYNAERIELRTWEQRHGVSGRVEDYFSDGVHPSLLTYQVWARDMARFILER